MLQTAQPEHPVLQAILAGDAPAFRQRLADERRMGGMPPYARLVGVIVRGEKEETVWEVAKALAREAAPLTEAGADVFGPAPAPFAMLRGEHRVRLLVRLERTADHAALIEQWRGLVKVPSGVRVVFDVDPYSFL
jgi:primosomal protein N' (replication factor Y)